MWPVWSSAFNAISKARAKQLAQLSRAVTTDQARDQTVSDLELPRIAHMNANRKPDQNSESILCRADPKWVQHSNRRMSDPSPSHVQSRARRAS
jgi:hypothetical protein